MTKPTRRPMLTSEYLEYGVGNSHKEHSVVVPSLIHHSVWSQIHQPMERLTGQGVLDGQAGEPCRTSE
jgi:hypothetical protein